jgi:hypothetical protein
LPFDDALAASGTTSQVYEDGIDQTIARRKPVGASSCVAGHKIGSGYAHSHKNNDLIPLFGRITAPP